ncbi:putative secretion system protein PilL [Xenorhabdus mauleonii]|uniref:Secretion system protein PilL n=1 Tax=Xenorhabdus mauleonii TaxID=351675 RepID=A0A1I3V655_9GAMM|nr:TcpQ domain-containing protein [Xenorhabdus mauleonii]PHM37609.1 putative secretion system protein PilL [Xenorhabdus mauleonii]SFJ89677.1 Toxin co-regulated pilus biosynthesis protein Q [Xenorhabdus mauleonii]
MKKLLPVALAPAMLSGCATTIQTPPAVPAQKFVTTLIQEQLPIIKQAHSELAQVSRTQLNPKYPATSLDSNKATKSTPSTSTSSSLTAKAVSGLQAIRYIGTPPKLLVPASAGKSETLNQAVMLILPVHWQQNYGKNIKPEVHESLQWESNSQWPYVLNQIMMKKELIATIDWTTQRVSISSKPVSEKSIPALSTFGAAKPKLEQTMASSEKTAVIGITPKPITQRKVWRIEAGDTLKDALFNWSTNETCTTPGIKNWSVVWATSINYRVDAPLKFEGSYHDALNSLFTLYGAAKIPLYAGIRNEQCVLSVDDKEIH